MSMVCPVLPRQAPEGSGLRAQAADRALQQAGCRPWASCGPSLGSVSPLEQQAPSNSAEESVSGPSEGWLQPLRPELRPAVGPEDPG